jgi:hypothetical protein
MNIAKAIPTFNHKFASNQIFQGANHKNNHPGVAIRIQTIILPECLMDASFLLKNCIIAACFESKNIKSLWQLVESVFDVLSQGFGLFDLEHTFIF